jgi:hypothetical protein
VVTQQITLIATEEYDGASWTAGGNLNIARGYLAGAGTQTSGLAFGGKNSTIISASTEEYNGTSWTTSTNLTTAKQDLAGNGTRSSALASAGRTGLTTYVATTEEFTLQST